MRGTRGKTRERQSELVTLIDVEWCKSGGGRGGKGVSCNAVGLVPWKQSSNRKGAELVTKKNILDFGFLENRVTQILKSFGCNLNPADPVETR